MNDSPVSTHPPCPACGGSGQTSFFQGESRFHLTWDDCPDCCGTGVLIDSATPTRQDFTIAPGDQEP